ncbi:MAG: methyl-accepting chemotaxis protein [Lachnospiraceae bacterium]|nr:methyl-accepting chemotaxis protein [Lachnospiraceae bacterium]
MKNLKVKNLLTLINVALVCLVALILAGISIYNFKTTTDMASTEYENAMNNGYQLELKSQVQAAVNVLQAEYNKIQTEGIPEEEAKNRAKEIVREMRYRDDGSGYFWIDDTDYILIMHSVLPEQEGNNRHDVKDLNGVFYEQSIIKTATGPAGCGYNEFHFTKADGVTVAPKLSYSQLFEPWNWIVSTGNYIDEMQAEMEEVHQAIDKKFSQFLIFIISITLVLIVLSFLIARFLGSVICKPLEKIQQLALRLSGGNLSTPVDVSGENELGQTAKSLNEAQTNMVSLLSDVRGTSDLLSAAVSEFKVNFSVMGGSIQNVALAVNEIADNSTGQAGSTSAASTGIGEISESITRTASEAGSLETNTKTMQDYSSKSMQTLENLISVSSQTTQDISEMYSQTETTNSSVEKIRQAADLISQISSQTNLLSLNASIEAARAGDSGRGFAVVAGEIGNLATQSDATAKEINKIIGELTENSSKSVQIMNRINDVSKQQLEALDDTEHMFMNLQKSLNSCIDSTNVITEHIAHVNEQKDMIMESVNTLSELATSNAASTEETSSMATELETAVSESNHIVEDLSADVEKLARALGQFQF